MSVIQIEMKQTTYIYLMLIFTSLIVTSCYKDDVRITEDIVREYPNVIIEETKVGGELVTSDGEILNGAEISFAGQASQASFPYFYFESNFIDQNFEILRFRNGHGLLLQYPISNAANDFNIHKIVVPHQFKTTEVINNSLTIKELQNEISFKNLTFHKQDELVEGPIIYFSELTEHSYPGNMQGFSEIEQAMIVNPQEVFYLGWQDEEITGKFSTTELEDSSYDLFHLDNDSGQWKYFNTTDKLESGFYATGIALPAINISLSIDDAQMLDGNNIKIQIQDKILYDYRITSSSKLPIFIPEKTEFSISIYNGEIKRFEDNYLLSENQDINIALNNSNLSTCTIYIKAKDCNDNDLKNALNKLEVKNQSRLFPSGKQEIKLAFPLGTQLSSKTISGVEQHVSNAITLALKEDIFVGRQYLCEELREQYMYFITDGNKAILSHLETLQSGDEFQIKANMEATTFLMKIRQFTEGSIADDKANIYFEAPELAGGYRLNCGNSTTGCGFNNLEITHRGTESGDYIKGKFDGKFWIESYEKLDVGYRQMVGEFQIKVQ